MHLHLRLADGRIRSLRRNRVREVSQEEEKKEKKKVELKKNQDESEKNDGWEIRDGEIVMGDRFRKEEEET